MNHEEDKSNSTNEAGNSHAILWAGIAIVMLPILYVLSCAPVIKFAMSGQLSPELAQTYITPLIFLYDHTPLQGLIEWYLLKWGV